MVMMVYKTLQKQWKKIMTDKHFKRAAVHPQRKKAKQGENAEKRAENVKRAAK